MLIFDKKKHFPCILEKLWTCIWSDEHTLSSNYVQTSIKSTSNTHAEDIITFLVTCLLNRQALFVEVISGVIILKSFAQINAILVVGERKR